MRQELDQLKVRLEREQEQCKNMIATEKSRWKKVHFRGGVKPNRTNFELIFLEFFELKMDFRLNQSENRIILPSNRIKFRIFSQQLFRIFSNFFQRFF